MTKLKSLRKYRGLTQAEVSKKTGISLYKLSLADRGHSILNPLETTALQSFFGRPLYRLLQREVKVAK